MKYNWSILVDEMRDAILELTTITGQDSEHTIDLTGYLRETMRSIDTFHPFDADRDLARAFESMPNGKCNYRSVSSYWAHKDGKEKIIDAISWYLGEMTYLIEDHFRDPWNFPPGYVKPKSIEFGNINLKAEQIVARTIRHVKM